MSDRDVLALFIAAWLALATLILLAAFIRSPKYACVACGEPSHEAFCTKCEHWRFLYGCTRCGAWPLEAAHDCPMERRWHA